MPYLFSILYWPAEIKSLDLCTSSVCCQFWWHPADAMISPPKSQYVLHYVRLVFWWVLQLLKLNVGDVQKNYISRFKIGEIIGELNEKITKLTCGHCSVIRQNQTKESIYCRTTVAIETDKQWTWIELLPTNFSIYKHVL